MDSLQLLKGAFSAVVTEPLSGNSDGVGFFSDLAYRVSIAVRVKIPGLNSVGIKSQKAVLTRKRNPVPGGWSG